MTRLPRVAAVLLATTLAGCSSAEPETPGAPDDGGEASGFDSGGTADSTTPDGSPDAQVDGGAEVDTGDAAGAADAPGDADGGPECAPYGAPGTCITTDACAALGDHTSYAGYCPGASDIQCCIVTPSTADNPPTPAGWVLMQQSQVTSAMTTWAVQILDDPTDYPMFSTATMVFGTLDVLARVEWHPPDSNNETIHRGVTLYEPAD